MDKNNAAAPVGSVDTPEFRALADAWSAANAECCPSAANECWTQLTAHIDTLLAARAAPGVPAEPLHSDPSALGIATEALRFYADQAHFHMHDSDAWDTVSGEPVNFYEDDANTATVEDGSVAKMALETIAGAPRIYPADPAVPAPVAKLTKGEARTILDMALNLEKTGRICSLSDGQERSDMVARNRSVQCALTDVLESLTIPAPAAPVASNEQPCDECAGTGKCGPDDNPSEMDCEVCEGSTAAPAAPIDRDSEMPRSEQVLRRLLAYRFAGAALYTDDGELQDNCVSPHIDFKRDSVDQIETKMGERIRAMADATPLAVPLPADRSEAFTILTGEDADNWHTQAGSVLAAPLPLPAGLSEAKAWCITLPSGEVEFGEIYSDEDEAQDYIANQAVDGCYLTPLFLAVSPATPPAAPEVRPTTDSDIAVSEKKRVLRAELGIIIGCNDGQTGKQKADAVMRWIETYGWPVAAAPTQTGVAK